MALRSERELTVATTGPRSAAVAAPQVSGKRTGPRDPGCDVSLIWPLFPSALIDLSSRFPFLFSTLRERGRGG